MAELPTWPEYVYSSAQVRAFDSKAINELGIDGFSLMQRAAKSAIDFLIREWPDCRSIVVVCGAGNNAGDGYVLAKLAADRGIAVTVIAVVPPEALGGDAAKAIAMACAAEISINSIEDIEDLQSRLASADVVVDALLGTGLTREVSGLFRQAVEQINAADCPVLALDIPTGLDSDTGEVRGVAVAASATMTFVGLKTGLYLGRGPDYRGRLAFSDLDLPSTVYAGSTAKLRRLDEIASLRWLRRRSPMAHKGSNGRVVVVGGSDGMAGAARLAANAALRAGAGLVYAAVAPGSVGQVAAGRPEIMCRGVRAVDEVLELVEQSDVMVIGPGLGRSDWGQRLAEGLLECSATVVADADALNYLAGHRRKRERWVLTPHPAEAGRLLDRSTAAVQAARRDAAAELAQVFGAIAVLKGSCSLVSEPTDNKEDIVSVCDYGNPGMATGGTGDVLAGLIGGLIAQFGFSRQVVETGVLVHALAGDDAAVDGERGMIASDLLPGIRRRVNPN